MASKFKISALTLAVLASMNAFAADDVAQEDNQSTVEEDTVEVISVKGFKGSLLKAINRKRFADGVVDSIHAEDIGKSTDQNIGDALSRITGVTVQEEDGEGTRISVRGAQADMNQVSLNGVALTSGLNGNGADPGFGQSVDLSQFSSDILSSIDVIKTPSADHDEGSLGANVILRTVKPLQLSERRASVTLQGRYNDYSDDVNGKVSFSVSDKFFDDTFGAILTFADETQNTRSDSFFSGWNEFLANVESGRARHLSNGEVITEDMRAFHRGFNSFGLNLNERNRRTVNLGLQYAPTSELDIQLDLSRAEQDLVFDSHSMSVNTSLTRGDSNNAAEHPQEDWWTVDTATRVLVKNTNFNTKGGLNRSIGGKDVSTDAATLKINYQATDELSVELTAGMSRTKDDSKRNLSASTATWNTLAGEPNLLEGQAIEPVGIDCSTGPCSFVFNSGSALIEPGIEGQRGTYYHTSMFMPFDLASQHLGGLNQHQNNNTDTNKSVFLDFDYDLDLGPITTLEFGAKYSERVKDVFIDKASLSDISVPAFNEDGQQVVNLLSPQFIGASEFISPNAFPVNNFMHGVAADGFGLEEGWSFIDPEKALSIAFQEPNVRLIPNPAGTKKIEQDNHSLYGKVNFELMDGRLRGDFGLRYVKTKMAVQGYTSVNFDKNANHLTPYDIVYRKGLANESLPVCDYSQLDGSVDDLVGGCYEPRITHIWGAKANGPTDTIPVPGADGTVSAEELERTRFYQMLDVVYGADGNVQQILQNDSFRDHPEFELFSGPRYPWRVRYWVDNTTDSVEVAGSNKFTGENVASNWLRNFSVEDGSESSVLLPSLNLNYQLNDEIITRFAVSRTMTRPNFNDISPDSKIVESIWADRGWGSVGNPQLKPLKSDNLDLSFEWYFDDTGLAAFTLYRKDMKDFIQQVNEVYYWADIRQQYDLETISLEDLLIIPDGQTPADGCMPVRQTQWRLALEWQFGCDELRLGTKRNGASTTTQGFEVNYVDTYDSLPGAWSGLGLSMNYTFADSESDPEASELTGELLDTFPMRYTPRHSANTAIFWEYEGISLRLAHRYNGIQYTGPSGQYRRWQDATNRLDFSASYKVSQNVSLSFQALNLTDDVNRQFVTADRIKDGFVQNAEGNFLDDTGEVIGITGDDGVFMPSTIDNVDTSRLVDNLFSEGDPMRDGNVDTSKTTSLSKSGRQYRFSVRVDF
ncbi:TonB-dependent receptor [Agaribacter marinus]|uniref:TonB-dependent receptor n=1 Tax=Agaribacter marinus TaxID=1431249 RepID=A0AA37WG72_9ALTE|nr:TonB-dependent receptor [Agaribacter marinus]GLR69811.1 hypothetical protein GCM10007852_07190 [Agaribacter marinus]